MMTECEGVPARRGLRYWWPIIAVGVLIVGYVGLAGIAWLIEAEVDERAGHAMREFGGDGVEALVALVQSDAHSLAERNRAVWALGQLRDKRALEPLGRLYTGGECDHEKFLCQRELKKAIDKCSGKAAMPAWLPFFP